MTGHLSFQELNEILKAEILLDDGWIRDGFQSVYSSDLMSDILAYSRPNSLLLTGLINPQTIRTAEMVEIAAICFVHGKQPHTETVEAARQINLPLLSTRFSMFEACGRLFAAWLQNHKNGA